MAGRAVANKAPAWMAPLKKWAYNLSGFNKLGLHHDDCLDEYNEDVKEALRRLPPKQLYERQYRIVRAMQLTIQHDILPKDQWVKFEEDNRYLQPYIEMVKKERAEREEWEKNH